MSVFDLSGSWKDQNGRAVRLSDVAGEQTVVAMIYTSCTVTCPLIISALKRIEASLPANDTSVRFVLVSIDPDRDTPGRLAAWAEETRLDTARWSLLAGSDATVRELAVTFDVRYQKQSDGEIAHTNGFSIIDRSGQLIHHQDGYSDVDGAVRVLRASLR